MSQLDKNGLTEEEFLKAYTPKAYPQPSVTADNVILSKDKQGYELLLIRRGGHPCLGMWALPGGFLNEEEPPYLAAERELQEETGLAQIPAVLLGVFGDTHRDPRCWTITCAYCALVDKSKLSPKAGDDAADAKWFRLSWSHQTGNLCLTLTGNGEQLTALLRPVETVTPLGTDVRFEILEQEGLAFDHAKVIATAVARLEQLRAGD